MHPTVTFFSFELPTYLIMNVLGILSYIGVTFFINRKHQQARLNEKEILFMLIFIGAGALIGSRLLFILTQLPSVFIDDVTFLDVILSGGSVFYGGLIGGLILAFIYANIYHLKTGQYANLMVIGIPLGHAFGRVGCFFSGCCHGKPTDSIFGVVFPEGPLHPEATPPVHPTQLYEALFLLILFGGLLFYFFKKPKHKPYIFLVIYLLAYGVFRFIIEFLRGDDIRGVWILSTSQWISLAIVIGIGVILMKQYLRKHKSSLR